MTWNQHRANPNLDGVGTTPSFSSEEEPFERWSQNVNVPPSSSPIMSVEPIIYGTRVYFGGGGRVYGFRLDDGSTVFDTDIASESSMFGGEMVSSVAVDAEGVYAYLWDGEEAEVFALNPSNGEIKWQLLLDYPAFTNLLLDDGKLYLGGGVGSGGDPTQGANKITRIDTGGSKDWEVSLSFPSGNIAVNANQLFAIGIQPSTAESSVLSFPKSNPDSEIFSTSVEVTDPWLTADSVGCVLLGRRINPGKAYYRIDAATGDVVWSTDGQPPVTGVCGEGFLYVGLYGQGVIAIERGSGNIGWEYTSNGCRYGPILFGNSLYFTDGSSQVYELDKTSGEQTRSFSMSGDVSTSMAASSSNLVTVAGGKIVCYGTETPDPVDDYVPDGRQGLIYFVIQYVGPDTAALHAEGVGETTDFEGADINPPASNLGGWATMRVWNEDTGNTLLDGELRPYFPGEQKVIALGDAIDTTDRDTPNDVSLSNNVVRWELDIKKCHRLCRFRVSYGCVMKSDHIHNPRPGIQQMFQSRDPNEDEMVAFEPEQATVEINGEEVGTVSLDEADDRIAELDIYGKLNNGSVNDINVKVSNLGHLQVWIEGDVYRRIMGRG